MGIKINQYPLERLVFGDDDYYDIDYWTGSSYETAKIKGSVIKAAIQAGIISENLFTTNNLNLPANREHYLTDKEFKFTINDVPNSIVGNARFGSVGLIGYLEDTAGATTTSYNFNGQSIILIADGTGNYTSLTISPGSIALSEGGTDISIDGTNTQLTAGNGTLQLGTVGLSNTWYTDNSVNKYGILLIGFGETSETNGTGANYTTLVDTSLVPKKYVDDAIASTSPTNFADTDLTLTGDRNHELDSNKLIFRCKLTANSDRIEMFYNNSPVGGMVVDHYDKFGTKIHSVNRDSFENEAYAVGYYRSGMDLGPKSAIEMRGFSGTNSYIKFSNQFSDQYSQIGANVPHYFLNATGALATNKFIVGNNSVVASESISFQGSTLIKGEGTSTGSTLALYDNDTTPSKILEVLDNGEISIDSTKGYLANPFTIEGYPFAGTGNNPYFKIKGYGEVEILGRLSNLFNVQNGAGAKQFEVLNGTTKINGASQINSTWFQVLTDTQKMSFNAGSGGALHHEIKTNGGGGPITTKFNIPGGGYQFIVGASAILGTEKISLQGDTLVDGSLDMNSNRILNSVVNPSVQETTSTATFTINSDEETDGVLTAMAANTTIASPTGTPVQSQSLIFRFKDDGTARTLTWNAIFRAIGITLPTTTTANKLLYVGCKYNSTDTKWDVVSVQEEA